MTTLLNKRSSNDSSSSNSSTSNMSSSLSALAASAHMLTTPLPSPLLSSSAETLLSASGFSFDELRQFSFVLFFVVCVGLCCHLFVVSLLIYQQTQHYQFVRDSKELASEQELPTTVDVYENSAATFNFASRSNPVAGHNNNNNSSTGSHQKVTSGKRRTRDNKYSNYVTYAFIFHQSCVDFLRLLYSLLYANRLYVEYERGLVVLNAASFVATVGSSSSGGTSVGGGDAFIGVLGSESSIVVGSGNGGAGSSGSGRAINSADLTLDMNEWFNVFYDKYCTQMASFYSVLTMVTIVNILTILISETCRFYDLKFNTNDSSNYCCVLFGVMLIWISSLIIISSLMLVGVAGSAAPTWQCDLGESESSTRSLVINIVWFMLVSFVLLIAVSYSYSLYKELNTIDGQENRVTLYAVNASLMSFKAVFLERQLSIVRETTKRLFIMVLLIVIFCVTFLPNFVATVLNSTLAHAEHASRSDTVAAVLRPFSLISSIINLSNSTLNSIVLLLLCVKWDDSYLSQYDSLINEDASVASATTAVAASTSSGARQRPTRGDDFDRAAILAAQRDRSVMHRFVHLVVRVLSFNGKHGASSTQSSRRSKERREHAAATPLAIQRIAAGANGDTCNYEQVFTAVNHQRVINDDGNDVLRNFDDNNNNNKNNNDEEDDDDDDDDINNCESCVSKCHEDCIQLQMLGSQCCSEAVALRSSSSSSSSAPPPHAHSKSSNSSSSAYVNQTHHYHTTQTSVKEFYSKIGNRLGNPS